MLIMSIGTRDRPLGISTGAVSKNVSIPEGSPCSETDSRHKHQPANNGSTASLFSNSNLDLVTKTKDLSKHKIRR